MITQDNTIIFIAAHKDFQINYPINNSLYNIITSENTLYNNYNTKIITEPSNLPWSKRRNLYGDVSRLLYIGNALDKITDKEYIGFCHYRRFFDLTNIFNNSGITEDTIITAEPMHIEQLQKQYAACHIGDNFIDMCNFLELHYPHLISNISYFDDNNIIYPHNMFIMHKTIFKKFVSLLNDVFTHLDKLYNFETDEDVKMYIDIKLNNNDWRKTTNQQKIYSYLCERLSSLFFKEYNIFETPVKIFNK